MTDPRRRIGQIGEQLAADHLERLGFQVLARNYRTRHGELDIVARDERTLVFCEVKTRREGPGDPLHDLHAEKLRRVRAMARAYLAAERTRARAGLIRFDAIAIVLDAAGRLVRLDHYEAAF